MITVNLEKELLRQNRRIHTPKELLRVQQAEKLATVDTTALSRVGMIGEAAAGSVLKQRAQHAQQQIAKFNQERVFHISQIESLCKKYYLRFLPSCLYNGDVDPQLAAKIDQFEIAYGVECESRGDGYFFRGNTFIVAPATSFKLEERPKDPLFFCEVAPGYYYLIHKWGNDLSIWNRCKALLSMPLISLVVNIFLCVTFGFLFWFTDERHVGSCIAWSVAFVYFLVANIVTLSDIPSRYFRFFKRNEWNSSML